MNDPEVRSILQNIPTIEVDYFGIESEELISVIHFDLNSRNNSIKSMYDLVISSHVLEHIWNHGAAFENFRLLLKGNALIWLNCPTSCHPHGSPYFYSAGYTAEYLSLNLGALGFSEIYATTYGSRRWVLFEHTFRRWPSRVEFENPLRFLFTSQPQGIMSKLKYLPQTVLSMLYSREITEDMKWGVQTLYLGRLKPNIDSVKHD